MILFLFILNSKNFIMINLTDYFIVLIIIKSFINFIHQLVLNLMIKFILSLFFFHKIQFFYIFNSIIIYLLILSPIKFLKYYFIMIIFKLFKVYQFNYL